MVSLSGKKYVPGFFGGVVGCGFLLLFCCCFVVVVFLCFVVVVVVVCLFVFFLYSFLMYVLLLEIDYHEGRVSISSTG